ncbi:hypothetical protein [Paucibacter soli]|uniref:hypothetical protein n=1 Tax=Paucibacter soli TaxID=3133433 RepID=UPI0030AD8A84
MQFATSQPRQPQQPSANCGWFDSSLELRQGLDVHELSDLELLALWSEIKPAQAALN